MELITIRLLSPRYGPNPCNTRLFDSVAPAVKNSSFARHPISDGNLLTRGFDRLCRPPSHQVRA